MKSKRAKRRAAVWKTLQQYKQSIGCNHCGYNTHPVALQFNHLRDKKGNISDLVRSDYGWATIWAEVAKCEILCANCHSIVTHLSSD